MKTLNELLDEALIMNTVLHESITQPEMIKTLEESLNDVLKENISKSIITKSHDAIDASKMKSYAATNKMVSKWYKSGYENIIGTISYSAMKNENLTLYELSSDEKDMFEDEGDVYGTTSGSGFEWYIRIDGKEVYVLGQAWSTTGRIRFQGPYKIDSINVINKKYFNKF